MPIIQQINSADDQRVHNFLMNFEETSQFLLSNLKAHGPYLSDHPNSGNFKMICHDQEIIGIYCLTARGNLLAQGSEALPAQQVIEDCRKEGLSIKGFIGEWSSIEPLFECYKDLHPLYNPTYVSKEYLYRFDLPVEEARLAHDPRVRFLEEGDFDQWALQSKKYNEELGLPNNLSPEQMKKNFVQRVRERQWWGLFINDKLISRVALNSKGLQTGQVGGVFTPKNLRKKGYAKATMLHMLKDCTSIHGHNKSFLFTGEKDTPAQKLYESIGYQRIGDFGLILG